MQPNKQTIVQSKKQPTNQPANQKTHQPTSKTTKQPTNQPNNQPGKQLTNQPTNQPNSETTENQPINQTPNQPTNQTNSKIKSASWQTNSVSDKTCVLLCYSIAISGNSLSTFWENLPVISSKSRIHDFFMMRHIYCSETSVMNCHYLFHNNPKERSSHLLHGGSLKISTKLTEQLLKTKCSTSEIGFTNLCSALTTFLFHSLLPPCLILGEVMASGLA